MLSTSKQQKANSRFEILSIGNTFTKGGEKKEPFQLFGWLVLLLLATTTTTTTTEELTKKKKKKKQVLVWYAYHWCVHAFWDGG